MGPLGNGIRPELNSVMSGAQLPKQVPSKAPKPNKDGETFHYVIGTLRVVGGRGVGDCTSLNLGPYYGH